MATILLSTAGAAIGGAVGGTVAGLSSAVIGRAVGATLGRIIDQRLLGHGSDPVETGKIDRFRLTQVGDGSPVTQVYGRMRVGGQVIWASDFLETSTTTGGGKGSPSTPEVTRYSYSVSLAVAVCKGEISGINRIWADGDELALDEVNVSIYTGTDDQLPDPAMEAIEGTGLVPAYRGTAYVVFQDLALERFGNRVPQFSFEVVRQEQRDSSTYEQDLAQLVKGVALIPGTGEYALATSPVYYSGGPGSKWPANLNSPAGQADFVNSMNMLRDELPSCDATSLVVSWFGDDLRCGHCSIRPKIERAQYDGSNMPWSVSGVPRAAATEIARVDDRPIYGGTPADASVVQAIRHMNAAGQRVMFYPFILMEQMIGNGLSDPWTGAADQPHLPWRGRITLSVAPGQPGTPDQTSDADDEVADFFGSATAADFVIGDGVVTYNGPDEWGLRRFILHYAALCAAAGGVDAFCISSEMRSLTQIRGASGFPAVQQLRDLAADVRMLLGPDVKIGYAADWSEYFGYQPQDGSGDRYFHLDPLWADPNIDFIGIDNYMPLSDWREGDEHSDAVAGWDRIYNLEYLKSNVAGGEGYDWYYHSPEAAAAQIRTAITDDGYDEPWVWRYKDLLNWWLKPHHDRVAGVRQSTPTAWEPQSKPFWFTELGCASIDKGTNQPNKFIDPKSSESSLPKYSNGKRDDFIQQQYLRAVLGYWDDEQNNPVSELYGAPMVDLAHAYVWAWDTRPYPTFPNNREQWNDGENFARGHWLNGRAGARRLSSVVEEICHAAEVYDIDVSSLDGVVHGYVVDDVADGRSSLQPLMLRYGFDAVERDGVLTFRLRDGRKAQTLQPETLAISSDLDGVLDYSRAGEAEQTGRVRVRFVQAGGGHDIAAEEAVLPDEATHAVAVSDLPMAMTRAEGRQVAERWLAEARVSRDTARFALPPSRQDIGAGDIVDIPGPDAGVPSRYRVDRVEHSTMQLIDAVRIEPNVYDPPDMADDVPSQKAFAAPVPVASMFLDLPLLTGDEVEHAPHIAVTANPWPGSVAVYASASDSDYLLERVLTARSVIGVTETPLLAAPAGRWDRADPVQVKLINGTLESRSAEAVQNGANAMAIGDGTPGNWEIFQFQSAELIAPETYWLSNRLRGQLGSDGLMPDVWPVGSWVILLDSSLSQIDLASTQRRISRHYRIGPARRPIDDPSYIHLNEAFDGNGLRPYAPVHLQASESAGDLSVSWVRRTRIDGDSWDLAEVPLGEETERYDIRVRKGSEVLRQTNSVTPYWIYTQTEQASDGANGAISIEVAQVSARYGPGLYSRIDVVL